MEDLNTEINKERQPSRIEELRCYKANGKIRDVQSVRYDPPPSSSRSSQ